MTLVPLAKRGSFGAGHNVWQAISAADLTNFRPDPADELIRLDLGLTYSCVQGGGLAIKGAFTPPAAPASVSHVSAASAAGNDITTGAISTTGADFIVAVVAVKGTPGVSDSSSNTWLPLYPTMAIGGSALGMFYALKPTTSGTHTFSTTGGNATFPAIAVAAFSGASGGTAGITNNQASTSTGAATLAIPSGTPSQNSTVIVAGLCMNTAWGTLAIDSGFTIAESINKAANSEGVALAYLLQTNQAAVGPTWSGLGVSPQNRLAQMAAFLHSQ